MGFSRVELATLRHGPAGIHAVDSGSGNPKGQQPPGLGLGDFGKVIHV